MQQGNQALQSNVAETSTVPSIVRTQHNDLDKHSSVTDQGCEAHQLGQIESRDEMGRWHRAKRSTHYGGVGRSRAEQSGGF